MKMRGASAQVGMFTMHKAVSVWTAKHSVNVERYWNSYYNPSTTELQGVVAGKSSYFPHFWTYKFVIRLFFKTKQRRFNQELKQKQM